MLFKPIFLHYILLIFQVIEIIGGGGQNNTFQCPSIFSLGATAPPPPSRSTHLSVSHSLHCLHSPCCRIVRTLSDDSVAQVINVLWRRCIDLTLQSPLPPPPPERRWIINLLVHLIQCICTQFFNNYIKETHFRRPTPLHQHSEGKV